MNNVANDGFVTLPILRRVELQTDDTDVVFIANFFEEKGLIEVDAYCCVQGQNAFCYCKWTFFITNHGGVFTVDNVLRLGTSGQIEKCGSPALHHVANADGSSSVTLFWSSEFLTEFNDTGIVVGNVKFASFKQQFT